ncbi:MAG TPA: peptidyl-prolyl cis-trans isomerase, partial [Bacteroidota bacterium]|nr:peptidyl-prolyl cis-trans isomerase [Bacteroidota bacterium]
RSADDLKEVVLGLAARDEILHRAEELGLEDDAHVADQIENLSGELRLRHWAAAVQDTVGRNGFPDTLLRRVYDENKQSYVDPPMVNVAEVLVRTEAEAKRVTQQARRGADFAQLARTQSIRLWAAKRGGELGFNTRAGYGVMGEKFFAARVGDIVGPDRVDPYWGVFKVVERKEGRIRSFEESKDQTVAYVNEIRKREAFQSALNALRERAQISMNVEHLATIAVH